MAASFHTVVERSWEELRLPKAVKHRTFLYTEQAFGFGNEPVLSESDLLAMTSQAQQLFRFFIKFEVFEESGNVLIRFNNLSDLNLFLYNKVKLADQRTLGTLRQNVTSRKLRSDDSGQFRLFSIDLGKQNPPVSFDIKEREVDGTKEGTFLCFPNKLDLFKFLISEDAKKIKYLKIDPELIEEVDEVDMDVRYEDCCFKGYTDVWRFEVEEELERNAECFNIWQGTQLVLQEQLVRDWKLCFGVAPPPRLAKHHTFSVIFLRNLACVNVL